MIPAPFRTLRALRALNVAAVGLALAAITSAVLGGMLGDGGGIAELAVGASTWLIGTLWAALLRSQKRVTRRAIRIGWVLSPPLAALNAALAAQREAVASWREALGDLRDSVRGVHESLLSYHARLGTLGTRVGTLNAEAKRLETWADDALRRG